MSCKILGKKEIRNNPKQMRNILENMKIKK